LGNARFVSRTFRAFKLGALIEDRCEDYGQVATYRGGIAEQPAAFVLDDHHRFEALRPMLVCGNTAAMLQKSRYGRWFEVQGDRSRHHGLFPCGPVSGPAIGPAIGPASGPVGGSSASGSACCSP